MKLLPAILWGGLCAGILDFIGACVSNASRGVTPLRIAQSIASSRSDVREHKRMATSARSDAVEQVRAKMHGCLL